MCGTLFCAIIKPSSQQRERDHGMDAQKIIEQAVDGRYRDELVDLSRQIWELAEVGYEEK